MTKTKIQQNIEVLQLGIDLLKTVDSDAYRRPVEIVFNGSLGGHFRHILDHYAAFFDGLSSGRIDYESRRRDPAVETDRRLAMELSIGVVGQLTDLMQSGPGEAVEVLQEGVVNSSRPDWAASSVARELEFLLSHTVHHQALAAVMCRAMGMAVPEDFGVASSTLRYRLCAP